MTTTPFRAILAALILLAASAGVLAQTVPGANGTAPEAPAAPVAKDPLGRDTPQGLVAGLISALSAGDYERAVRYFEVERLGAGVGQNAVPGATLAEHLQSVLDRSGNVATVGELSNDPAGRVNDGLAEDLERIGTLGKLGNEDKPLIARRLERDGRQIWVISVESLRVVAALSRVAALPGGSVPLLERLPRGPTVLGAPLLHWGHWPSSSS